MADVTDETFERDVLERSDQVPVVVDLWAEWCGPCKTLGPILEKVIGATGGKVELAKIDVDANPQVAQPLQVQSIPAVFALKDRKIVSQFIGAVPEAEVQKFVDALLPSEEETEVQQLLKAGDEESLRQVLELEPANEDAIVGLAELLVGTATATKPSSCSRRSPRRPRPAGSRRWRVSATTRPSDDVDARFTALLDRVKSDDDATPGVRRPARGAGPRRPPHRRLAQEAHHRALLSTCLIERRAARRPLALGRRSRPSRGVCGHDRTADLDPPSGGRRRAPPAPRARARRAVAPVRDRGLPRAVHRGVPPVAAPRARALGRLPPHPARDRSRVAGEDVGIVWAHRFPRRPHRRDRRSRDRPRSTPHARPAVAGPHRPAHEEPAALTGASCRRRPCSRSSLLGRRGSCCARRRVRRPRSCCRSPARAPTRRPAPRRPPRRHPSSPTPRARCCSRASTSSRPVRASPISSTPRAAQRPTPISTGSTSRRSWSTASASTCRGSARRCRPMPPSAPPAASPRDRSISTPRRWSSSTRCPAWGRRRRRRSSTSASDAAVSGSVDDLLDVRGIGPAKLDAIRDLVTVSVISGSRRRRTRTRRRRVGRLPERARLIEERAERAVSFALGRCRDGFACLGRRLVERVDEGPLHRDAVVRRVQRGEVVACVRATAIRSWM